MAKDTSHLPVYKPTQFGKERQLNIRYGNNPSRKELQQFNDYWNSEQRFVDEHNHYMSELDKMFDSVQRNMEYLRNKYKPAQITPLQTSDSTKESSSDLKSNDTVVPEDTKKDQPQNGNNASSDILASFADPRYALDFEAGFRVPWVTYTSNLNEQGSSTKTDLPFTPKLTVNALWDSHLFDKYSGDTGDTDYTRIIVNGKPYFVVKTTGFDRNPSGIMPYKWYAFDPDRGQIIRLEAPLGGVPFSGRKHNSSASKKPIEGGRFAKGAQWKDPQALFEIYPTEQSIATKKQGGIMNKKINYFKSGGSSANGNSANQKTQDPKSVATAPKHVGFTFDSRTRKLTPGYSIVSQQVYPRYEFTDEYGEKHPYYNEFGGTNVGRVIYNSPKGADTVYYDKASDWLETGEGGYMTIGSSPDQEKAKKNFYRYINWVDEIGVNEEESREAYKRALLGHKQGGTMKYFQQGGAAPQQDMQQQIVALVQAAMQGDEKAVSTVNQIIEAAKSGDPQAVQLAQIIQQVLQQMQGQTASARLGAKLNYIRSLKYAKGGKTCQACNKKVEMKACGGKKAKKRYFGGLI